MALANFFWVEVPDEEVQWVESVVSRRASRRAYAIRDEPGSWHAYLIDLLHTIPPEAGVVPGRRGDVRRLQQPRLDWFLEHRDELLREHHGNWVAIGSQGLLASGELRARVREQARRDSGEVPLMLFIGDDKPYKA